jgi:uncharacterized protein YaaW (UPF0174 family)
MGQEPEEVKRSKEEMTLLNELQAKMLESIEKGHRHEVLRELKSKNHNAKRRAKKKIAKASRQRNR